MANPSEKSEGPNTVGSHFRAAWRKANARRPASFYLLFAMLAAVLLGSPALFVRDDPWKFFIFLSLSFVFFFVIILRALVDFIELIRAFFAEREQLFKDTLGDAEFAKKLGERMERRAPSRPPLDGERNAE